MDCSPPGSFVHGILQARILEWVAITSSTQGSNLSLLSPALQADSLPPKPSGEDLICYVERGNSHSPLADAPLREVVRLAGKGCLSVTDALRLGQLAGSMISLQMQ